MINLIKADFYKIHRSAIYKVLFLILTACAVATTLVSHFVSTGDIGFETAGTAALLTDVVMMNLASCIIAGQLVCGDFENKLIQSALTGTNGRFTVVCGKMITYTLLVGIMTLPYALSAIIGYVLDAGFCNPYSASVYLKILFESTTVDFSVAALLKYIVITAIMALAYAAQTAFVFMLAFLFKNKALIVTTIGFIACVFFGMTSSMIAGISDTANELISWTPFSADAYNMGNDTEIGTMIKVIGISLAFIAAFTYITYLTFKKSEIK
jgi:hypothetical protein